MLSFGVNFHLCDDECREPHHIHYLLTQSQRVESLFSKTILLSIIKKRLSSHHRATEVAILNVFDNTNKFAVWLSIVYIEYLLLKLHCLISFADIL